MLTKAKGTDELVMKKTSFIAAVPIMLLSLHFAQAGVSIVKNGSFEDDGYIGDIDVKAPRYWCDVNLPSGKFDGYVGWYGATHGDYALTIRVEPNPTAAGDIATISQQVYLEGVNKIIFDVTLSSALSFIPWDSKVRSAVVLLDGNDIWDSNNFPPNGQGEYFNQEVDINGIDAGQHTLSLAVRTNKNNSPVVDYYADWDFVKFDTYCGGFGYLPEDFDQDCYVDMSDLRLLAEAWLTEGPGQRCDLSEDGIIDFKDFSLFAKFWKANSYWENWGNDNCYAMELLLSDIDDSGEVDYGDILMLAGDWLNTGDCIRADLNFDGEVDFKDFAVLAGDWRQRSWLYWAN